jgi:hypothetical protein
MEELHKNISHIFLLILLLFPKIMLVFIGALVWLLIS